MAEGEATDHWLGCTKPADSPVAKTYASTLYVTDTH